MKNIFLFYFVIFYFISFYFHLLNIQFLFNNFRKMLFNKNHFIKISMIIVLLLANYNLCSNKLKKTSTNKVLNLLKTNIKTGDYNGGDWETGYKCPKFLIGKGDDSQVDQGGFLLKAKELKLNTGENLKGFILEFENAPKANSIITKIATKIDAVKYYLPWRFINSNQMNTKRRRLKSPT